MAAWKDDNTLNKLREAKVKWVKDGSGKWYYIKAEGYWPIEYDKIDYTESFPYRVCIPGVDIKPVSFKTRQEAQAYAEDHPKSEFPPISDSNPPHNPEAIARSEAKGWHPEGMFSKSKD